MNVFRAILVPLWLFLMGVFIYQQEWIWVAICACWIGIHYSGYKRDKELESLR